MQQAGIKVLQFNPINPAAARKRISSTIATTARYSWWTAKLRSPAASISTACIPAARSAARSGRTAPTRSPGATRTCRSKDRWSRNFRSCSSAPGTSRKAIRLPPRKYFPRTRARERADGTRHRQHAGRRRSVIHATLLSAISHAERSIHITNAYFVPGQAIVKALKAAAKRGVDVKIILPSQSDFWAPLYAGTLALQRIAASRTSKSTSAASPVAREDGGRRWRLVDRRLDQPRSAQLPQQRRGRCSYPGRRTSATQMEAMFRDDLAHSSQISSSASGSDAAWAAGSKRWGHVSGSAGCRYAMQV